MRGHDNPKDTIRRYLIRYKLNS